MEKITRNQVECAYKSLPMLDAAINALNEIDTGCVHSHDHYIDAVDFVLEVLTDSKKEYQELLAHCKHKQAAFDKVLLNKIYHALFAAQDGVAKHDRAKQLTLDAYNHQVDALKVKGFDALQIERIVSYPHAELAQMAEQQIERLALINKLNAFINSPDYDIDLLSGTVFAEAV